MGSEMCIRDRNVTFEGTTEAVSENGTSEETTSEETTEAKVQDE